MADTRAFFLRTVGGEPIGPLTRGHLTALLEAAVITPETPASLDGHSYPSLSSLLSPAPPLDPTAYAPSDQTIDLGTTVLRGMLAQAVKRASGFVRVHAAQGTITVAMKEGKVVAIETTVPALLFFQFLLDRKVLPREKLEAADRHARTSNTDLGGTLVANNDLSVGDYLEVYVSWALKVLSIALLEQHQATAFEAADVPAPAIPLGFDAFGVFVEAVRRGTERQDLDLYIEPHRSSPVILSSGDGVSIDACKLKPKELRVMNSVNGLRTVEDLIKELGTTDDAQLSVLQVLFFAEQAGFVVFGVDPRLEAEREEARRLALRRDELKKMNYFEILEVRPKDSNEAVRTKYTALAKRHHPDRLRQGAWPELVTLQRSIFALVSEAFDALETEDKRSSYAESLGDDEVLGQKSETARVEDMLRAETFFKKAQILNRVRKFDEALEHAEEAMRLNPKDVEFKMFAIFTRYLAKARGRPDAEAAQAAAKELLPLTEKHPEVAGGHLWLGHLYKHLRQTEKALRSFQKVLEHDPSHPEALQEVKEAERRRGK